MILPEDELEDEELGEEIPPDAFSLQPNEAADPIAIVEATIPADIRAKFEVISYRNAAIVLSATRKDEFGDLLATLRKFSITKRMIRTAGGNNLRYRNYYQAYYDQRVGMRP